MNKFLISLTFSALLFAGYSQNTTSNWKLYPSNTDSVKVLDTVKGVIKSTKPGTVKVIKDNRIDKVSDELGGKTTNKPPRIKGYRVQIISSPDKAKVDSERGRIMGSYPKHKTSIDYKAPNFRLRAGNFRSKLDAQKFQNQIMKSFPNTLIIYDEIEFPRLD